MSGELEGHGKARSPGCEAKSLLGRKVVYLGDSAVYLHGVGGTVLTHILDIGLHLGKALAELAPWRGRKAVRCKERHEVCMEARFLHLAPGGCAQAVGQKGQGHGPCLGHVELP